MDFITGMLRTSRKYGFIMVVVDMLTRVAHFISFKSTNLTSEVSHIFVKNIVRFPGVPKNIISNKDAKSTSRFWKELFAGLGIELDFSTTYHPPKYGQMERVNKIVEDILRMYVMHQ